MSAHCDDNPAFIGFTWNERRSRVPAERDAVPRVEEESTFAFTGADGVTLEAVFGEQWTDVFFKECEICLGWSGVRGWGHTSKKHCAGE
jgi:hypothetical protein